MQPPVFFNDRFTHMLHHNPHQPFPQVGEFTNDCLWTEDGGFDSMRP